MHRWDRLCATAAVVLPVRCDSTGVAGPTREEAAGPEWRRSSHGFYVPAYVDEAVPEQRIVEQAARLPEGGAVTGWAGCRLHRVGLVDGLDRDGTTPLAVPLIVGPGGRARGDERVRLLHQSVPAWEVESRYGVPVACLARCVHDGMRLANDEREATVLLDAAYASGLLSPQRMTAYARSHRGQPGQPKVDFALRWGSEHRRSPYETRLDLVLQVDGALPAGEPNRAVFSLSGRFLGVADLLDVDAGLVVEFDGADHRGGWQHTKDVRKQERLFAHGLEVCRVTGRDMADPAMVIRRVAAARARALTLARPREWMLKPRGDSVEQELCKEEDLELQRALAELEMPSIEQLERW